MARRKPRAPNVKKFGAPLYASAWIDDRVPLVAGGGGKKSSGIPNRVMLATFDGVELTEPLASVHTDETAPQVLCVHPDGAELLVAFSGDVAVYAITANDASTQLAETEESDAPSPEASAPYTISPRDVDSDGVLKRVTLEETCDVKCAAFSPDGASLAVGLENGEVRTFTWPSLEPIKTLGSHSDVVNGVAFSPDGTCVVTTSAETVKDGRGPAVWDPSSGTKIATLIDGTSSPNKPGRAYRFCGFSPDGSHVLTGLNDGGEGHVVRWACDTWSVVSTSRVTREPISAMAFDPTGATVAVGNCEGHVVLVDAKTLRVKRTVKGGHMIFVTTMAYSPDGSVLLSGSADASACCTVVSRGRGKGGGWDDVFEKAYAVIVCAVLAWLFFTVGRLSVRLQHAAVGPGGNGDVDVEHVDVLGGLEYADIKRVAADVRRKREAAEAESGGDASEPESADDSHKPNPDDTERLYADEDAMPYECVDGSDIKCEDVLTEPEPWEMRVKKLSPEAAAEAAREKARNEMFDEVPAEAMDTSGTPGLGCAGFGGCDGKEEL